MMSLDTAMATIANHVGHGREVILQAAQTLRYHIQPKERRAQTAREIVEEGRSAARDRLLLTMVDAQLRILTTVHNLDGCNAKDFHSIWGSLRDAKILFASTLDRS